MSVIKKIRRTGTQSKFFIPKLKTLNNVSFRLNKENVSHMFFDRIASILTVLVNSFDNFKRINVKLYIFKFHMVESK
jgi:hypothetical protein